MNNKGWVICAPRAKDGRVTSQLHILSDLTDVDLDAEAKEKAEQEELRKKEEEKKLFEKRKEYASKSEYKFTEFMDLMEIF